MLLNNCANPGTAFLGPAITGAKTGSVYQASISYGSGKFMNNVKIGLNSENVKENLDKDTINTKFLDSDKKFLLTTIKTYDIEISLPTVPEPLP